MKEPQYKPQQGYGPCESYEPVPREASRHT